jgi:hypothetical protein
MKVPCFSLLFDFRDKDRWKQETHYALSVKINNRTFFFILALILGYNTSTHAGVAWAGIL